MCKGTFISNKMLSIFFKNITEFNQLFEEENNYQVGVPIMMKMKAFSFLNYQTTEASQAKGKVR